MTLDSAPRLTGGTLRAGRSHRAEYAFGVVPGALCVAFRNRVGVVHFIVSDVRIGEGSPALACRLAGLADLGLFWRADAATAPVPHRIARH